jgi:hypothetical protein
MNQCAQSVPQNKDQQDFQQKSGHIPQAPHHLALHCWMHHSLCWLLGQWND